MQEQSLFYIQYLRESYAKKKQRNSSYSLRSFANHLDIDSGSLSAIMNNKRVPSLKLAKRILDKLDCSVKEEEQFLLSIAHKQRQRNLKRIDPEVRKLEKQGYSKTTLLDESVYQTVSEWHHAAILELTYKSDFKGTPGYIVDKLGISYLDAKTALERLLDLGLLKKEGEKIVKADHHLDGNSKGITSKALRKKQKAIREKAIEAIDKQPLASRYMTTVTMCIDPDFLSKAQKLIDQFNDSLCSLLESGDRKEVYTMEIGLFSLENGIKQK